MVHIPGKPAGAGAAALPEAAKTKAARASAENM